ncbi:MAG: type II toxin-antitoxin system VapC family toxin [Candidatus Sumerlaeota bacterium]|nr:type II toxin-antitoxin system VapC family toxin [Candidatus Sumerlaeota bacterium]
MFLLDTNVCIRILNKSSKPLVARLRTEDPSEIHISAITKAELLYGARHSARPAANLRLLDSLFAVFVSLPFDDPCAEHHAAIRADLSARGQLIGPHDLLIAATALAHDLTLVTHNTKEFSRVIGLRIEDWER